MIGLLDKYSINKANFALEISNNLTILERKFYNHILYYIEQQGWDKQTYLIPKSSFNKLIGEYKNQTFKKIHLILKRLEAKALTIVNQSKFKEYENCRYISYVGVVKGNNKDFLIELTPTLKNYLNINFINDSGKKNIELGYTRLDLNIVNRLTSTHDLALYENLLRMKNSNIDTIDLKSLKEILSCHKSYDQFKRLNQSILKPAIERINQLTDLNVSFDLLMNGNKVTKIKFSINQNNSKQILVSDIEEIKQTIPTIKPSLDIDLSQYPQEIEQIINIGIKPATKVIKWFEEDQRRLLANWYEINTKYTDKSNTEKAKLMAYLWKVNANYITRTEIEAKEKEMAYNIKQEAILKEQQQEQARQEAQNKEKANKAFEDTAKIYNQLSNQDKLELCKKVCANNSGVLRLNKCTEKDNYLSFGTLPKSIKAFIMNEINPHKVEQIKEAPQVFLSYKENEKKEVSEALKNLFNRGN